MLRQLQQLMQKMLKGFTLLIFLLASLSVVDAVVPEDCVYNVTKPSAICCPVYKNNGQVCGGPERGYCTHIAIPMQYVPAVFHVDDRVGWPSRFFSYACQCRGNFYGPTCEDCWFGWTGKDCNTRRTVVRKDIRDLTEKERHIFVDVMARSATWPSGMAVPIEADNFHSDPLYRPQFESTSIQYYIAYVHRYGSRTTLYKNDKDCNNYGILDFIHDGPVFASWHRYLMMIWERMLSKIAEEVHGITDFAAPYWDWTGMDRCDICTNQYIGAPGHSDMFGLRLDGRSPFSNWTEYCYEPNNRLRCYGCQHAGMTGKLTRHFASNDFPDQEDVRFVFNLRE